MTFKKAPARDKHRKVTATRSHFLVEGGKNFISMIDRQKSADMR